MAHRSETRDPQGIAHWDYSSCCPGCQEPIQEGDTVHKISLPGHRPAWWHIQCRREYRKALIYGDEH